MALGLVTLRNGAHRVGDDDDSSFFEVSSPRPVYLAMTEETREMTNLPSICGVSGIPSVEASTLSVYES